MNTSEILQAYCREFDTLGYDGPACDAAVEQIAQEMDDELSDPNYPPNRPRILDHLTATATRYGVEVGEWVQAMSVVRSYSSSQSLSDAEFELQRVLATVRRAVRGEFAHA